MDTGFTFGVDTDMSGSGDTPPPTLDGTERHCTECNALLPDHNGRGRKPTKCDNCKRPASTAGRRAPTSGSTKVVTEALGTMDGFYSMAEVALMIVSPGAAVSFTERRGEAMARNKAAFESNRRLAENVAKMGRSSGMAAFVLAQVYVAGPAVIIAAADVRSRRAARVAHEAASPAEPMERHLDDQAAPAESSDRFAFFL